jgi:hypothetical protein
VALDKSEEHKQKQAVGLQKSTEKKNQLEDLEREAEKEHIALTKRLRQAEKRQQEIRKNNMSHLKKIVEKEHETLLRVLDNNKKVHESRVMRQSQVLEKQAHSIERANQKEEALYQNKLNI